MSDADVAFIDEYAAEHGVDSRSGVVHRALRVLRASTLGDDYAAAWDEWARTDGEAWGEAVGDGLTR